MKFPTELQQNIEKWASIQGVSTEQFVWQAVFEKIDKLSQISADINTEEKSVSTNNMPEKPSMIYRKEGILVVDAEFPENLELNTFINDLREERIQDIMAL
ncbi:MAG: hypothetical protein F6K47_06710 [Symploca sp. SIO2E6]|nr:hypothetical protein [Symploca sp. SIO2E6]